MKSMGVNEIREKFLSFFESKGCLRLGSFPLIPKNDASLLLINSGMAPMKPWFQNPETAPKRRVTTCQKCIRTGDVVCLESFVLQLPRTPRSCRFRGLH